LTFTRTKYYFPDRKNNFGSKRGKNLAMTIAGKTADDIFSLFFNAAALLVFSVVNSLPCFTPPPPMQKPCQTAWEADLCA
jgi:hypothetical protein